MLRLTLTGIWALLFLCVAVHGFNRADIDRVSKSIQTSTGTIVTDAGASVKNLRGLPKVRLRGNMLAGALVHGSCCDWIGFFCSVQHNMLALRVRACGVRSCVDDTILVHWLRGYQHRQFQRNHRKNKRVLACGMVLIALPATKQS